jgi:hypothetical protein
MLLKPLGHLSGKHLTKTLDLLEPQQARKVKPLDWLPQRDFDAFSRIEKTRIRLHLP